MEVVRAEGLSKRFAFTWALRDVNLSLGRGVHLLLGPNGSGKTTFLKLAIGMLRATSGRIRVLNLDPWRQWPQLAARVSFAMEGAPLPWWMTGRDFLRELCSMKGVGEGRLEKLAAELGVDGYWGSSILTYSSGMAKRVLLLTAFLAEAELYVLDEPFTLIDRPTIARVTKLIAELRDSGSTFLIATHYIPGDFEGLADTIVRFEDGRVVSVEKPA
ncbi:MAG: ABC transporter ATP-binding protein [Thermofilaceae archaeon]